MILRKTMQCILSFLPLLGSVANSQNALIYENVIVGGGLSGLSTAYHLQKSGITNIMLYEGRDRLGGRTHTHHRKGGEGFFEEGGTFIEPDHHGMIQLAKELGVSLKTIGWGSRKAHVAHQNSLKTDAELGELLQSVGRTLEEKSSEDAYFQSNDQWYLKKAALEATFESPAAKALIETYYTGETGNNFDRMSLSSVLWIKETMKDFQELLEAKQKWYIPNFMIDREAYQYTVKEGMSSLIAKLETRLENDVTFILSHVLKKIDKTNDHYVLSFQKNDGGEHVVHAQHAVITLPFSTLRHVEITPNVPLSAHQMDSILTLPYGNHAKIGVYTPQQETALEDTMSYYFNLDHKITGWPGHQALTLFM